MLLVKKFVPEAKLPTVAHPGDDLGFDLYALGDGLIPANKFAKVRTGIGVKFTAMAVGFLLKDRSSMASKGLHILGGVIDAGYTGEIIAIIANLSNEDYVIHDGDKIVQMIPLPTLTRLPMKEVEELPSSERGEKGFGSSDKPLVEVIPASALK